MSALNHELIKKHEDILILANSFGNRTEWANTWLEARERLAKGYAESKDKEEKEAIFELVQHANEQIKQYLLL